MAERTKVFISYSHNDRKWLERLQVQLKPLERMGAIERWDDTKIRPGGKWPEEIREALAAAKVAVLLISADFLASDFIATDELPPLLAAAEAEGAVILPVILSPSRFERTLLAQFQAVNPPERPLMGLEPVEQERYLVQVTEVIEGVLNPVPPQSLSGTTMGGYWNVLDKRGKIDLGETVRIIFAQLATRITVQEIRATCRQSAAFGPLAPWPKGDTLAHYCTWLLDLVQLANGRHPLYDVLALLESKADAEQVRLIRSAMQRLITLYPGLVTDPLPAPVGPCTTEPAVFEIVFELRVSSEIRGYDVHSFWHPPAGEGNLSGPRRECEDGGRLDLGSADQIGSFAGELMDALEDWDIGAGEVVFLFRLPTELLLHPVEQWPQDRIGTWLGRDHPVVVAPRDRRRQRPCREFWQRITPRMDEPLREGIWYSSSAALACEPADVPEILNRIEQSTGIAITRVPDLSEPRQVTLLAILIERGVAIAFWPRHQDAEHGFREALDAGLGRQILANLPYALRDLRKADYGRGEASPVARHVALLWDDPQYQRKHSFPGIG